MKLKELIYSLWEHDILRQGVNPEFKPIFSRYIGVENHVEYNTLLSTINKFVDENKSVTVLFDSQIEMSVDFDLLNQITIQIQNLSNDQLSKAELRMFADETINRKFLNALEYTTLLAERCFIFKNASIRNNFISKLVVYAYMYIHKLDYNTGISPKCIYYGDITRDNFYFLIFLYKIGFDIIYVNSASEPNIINQTDVDKLSTLYEIDNKQPSGSFKERIRNVEPFRMVKSASLQYENQITEALFTDTGLYRPWQFKDGYTKALFFNSSIVDLETKWNIEARLRESFSIKDNIVAVPNFLFEIEGEYKDKNQYIELIKSLETNLCLIARNEIDLFEKKLDKQLKFQFVFAQLNDSSFDINKLKKMEFYPFNQYRSGLQDFILNKANETIRDTKFLVNPKINAQEMCEFLMLIFSLKEDVIRLIDSFDYTSTIPKLIIFLEEKNYVDKFMCYIIHFLKNVGFDIAIITPAGMSGLNKYVNQNYYNTARLDELNSNRKFSELNRPVKGFFKKILGKRKGD